MDAAERMRRGEDNNNFVSIHLGRMSSAAPRVGERFSNPHPSRDPVSHVDLNGRLFVIEN